MIMNVSTCILFPIIDSILGNKKVLALGFLIPRTDPDENFGYFCNLLFQNIQLIIVGYGYVVFLRIYWLYFAHACARIDILRSSVHDLNQNITDSDIENRSEILSIKLKEIVQLHTEYLRFVSLTFVQEIVIISIFSFIDILESVGKKILLISSWTSTTEIAMMMLLAMDPVI